MKTPLYDAHVALGARMTDFAGWTMPVQYTGILREHTAARTQAVVFDTCHMGEFAIGGPGALGDMERLFTRALAPVIPGRCVYGYLLADQGGVIDDAICYRRSETDFLLVVNAGNREADARWIRSHLSPSTRFEDLSDRTAKLDIQGPSSRAALEKALEIRLPELPYFHFAEINMGEVAAVISRTGYTGEWGYELFCPVEQVGRIWRQLLEKGGVIPAGLGARDLLRVEMGYPLYGHELSLERSPVAAAGARFMDVSTPVGGTTSHLTGSHVGQRPSRDADGSFIGSETVRRELADGVPRRLAGLRLTGRGAARQHDVVFDGDTPVGEVTSGLFSPSLNVAIAMAYLDGPVAQPGRAVSIQVRGLRLPATVVALPFYREGTARGVGSGRRVEGGNLKPE
ncbi:MAG: glycine cleavage system aminomethyltransferase GcvT [Lentisphaerae bacterium]|nr:glycine cleavage system aminomethyltransferase GcvT [Lentisphaerota bacterium]